MCVYYHIIFALSGFIDFINWTFSYHCLDQFYILLESVFTISSLILMSLLLGDISWQGAVKKSFLWAAHAYYIFRVLCVCNVYLLLYIWTALQPYQKSPWIIFSSPQNFRNITPLSLVFTLAGGNMKPVSIFSLYRWLTFSALIPREFFLCLSDSLAWPGHVSVAAVWITLALNTVCPLELQILFFLNFRKYSHYSFESVYSWVFYFIITNYSFIYPIVYPHFPLSALASVFIFFVHYDSSFSSVSLIWFSTLSFCSFFLIPIYDSWNGIFLVLNWFPWLFSLPFFLIPLFCHLIFDSYFISFTFSFRSSTEKELWGSFFFFGINFLFSFPFLCFCRLDFLSVFFIFVSFLGWLFCCSSFAESHAVPFKLIST